MDYTVFVSHASEDKDVAEKIAEFLEQQGIGCWIAPRDVRPGHEYAAEIVRGIAACPVMVLVLSEHANDSIFVKREIERGVSQGKPVFPIRVREVLPSQSLELFISSQHWIDAWKPPLEQYLGRLVEAIQVVVNADGKSDLPYKPARLHGKSAREPAASNRGRAMYWAGGIGGMIAIAASAWGVLHMFGQEGTRSEGLPESTVRLASNDARPEDDPLTTEPRTSSSEQTGESFSSASPEPVTGQTADREETGSEETVPDTRPAMIEQSGEDDPAPTSPDGPSFDQIMLALEDESGGQRYRTIESFREIIPPELSADQALAIVESSAYRLDALELLKDRLPETLSYEDVMKIVGTERGGGRYNTIKAFADRMPEALTTDQLLAIVESSAYRLHALELLKDRLPETLSYEDVSKIVGTESGGGRYNTIKAFADRVTDDLTFEQIESLVETSSYVNEARALLRNGAERT